MKKLFNIFFIYLFTFSFGRDCIHKVEVELWGECHNIQATTKLNVSGAGLTGEITPQISDLTHLYIIDLSNNRLSGSIPPEIGKLINLKFLYLQDNQLSGKIPSEIGNLINLTNLDLSKNQLSGSIPPEIGQLTDLTRLDLDYTYKKKFRDSSGHLFCESGSFG